MLHPNDYPLHDSHGADSDWRRPSLPLAHLGLALLLSSALWAILALIIFG